jgi:flagellin
MSRINTNVQALQSFSALQKTNNDMATRQLRLATGSRLNRAEDDTAGYTIASKLGARVRGQAQALSNIGDAKNMLTVAEGGLGSVMNILQTMKEKATQAANDTMGTAERGAIEKQLDALYNEIGDTLEGTEFNGKALFNGDTLNFQVGADSDDSFAVATATLSKATVVAGVSSEGRAASVGTAVKTAGGQYTAWDNAAVANGVSVTDNNYTGTHSGNLYFKKSGTDLLVSTEDTAAGFAAASTVDLTGYVAGTDLTHDGMSIAFDGDLADLEDGDGFAIEVEAAIAAGTDTFVGMIGSASDAQSIIGNIDAGIASISAEIAKLGDAQSRLTFKSDNLQTSMTNNDAAKSRMVDADFAKEQMEIVKLQILQQTGTAALSQANAAPQSVLSLLR